MTILTESRLSSMPVGVLRRFGLSSLVQRTDAELVLVAFLQLGHCTLADVALDLGGLGVNMIY